VKAPIGLKAPGRRFWRETVASFDMRADEALILEQTCRLLDAISDLEALLNGADLMLPGSMNQPRLHPAVGELRQSRAALGRLLAQLSFADTAQTTGERALEKSSRGRELARLRWSAG